jgi:type VI secretion system protein VasD
MHLQRLSSEPRGPFRLFSAGLALLLSAGFLAACSSPPPLLAPSKPTLVSTTLVAPNVNPDARKRPSPVVLRVYELKSEALFESTDFVSLFEKDQAVLGAEMLSREEFVLQPNDVKALNKNLSPDTRFIGVVAAFREIERARWRVVVPTVANKKNVVSIKLDDVNIVIKRESP